MLRPKPRPFMLSPRLLLAAALVLMPSLAEAQRVTITEQRAMRITLRSTPVPLPLPLADFRETRGPRCIKRAHIAGASLNGASGIDFMLRDGTRFRTRLQRSCPALNYYAGFYLNPTPDGMICSDRDALHARSGGECQIDAFRKLVPKAKVRKRRR